MPDYQKLYTTLFNYISDAIEYMDNRNFWKARDLLIHAQQETEILYIDSFDEKDEIVNE